MHTPIFRTVSTARWRTLRSATPLPLRVSAQAHWSASSLWKRRSIIRGALLPVSLASAFLRTSMCNFSTMRSLTFLTQCLRWWQEGLHGLADSPGVDFSDSGAFSHATSFPQPILMTAAFDDPLIHAVATVISTEGRAFNNHNHSGVSYIKMISQERQLTPGVATDRLLDAEYQPFQGPSLGERYILSHLISLGICSPVLRPGDAGRRSVPLAGIRLQLHHRPARWCGPCLQARHRHVQALRCV